MTLIIYALACWRVSHLIVHEDGPADMILLSRAYLSGRSPVFKSLLSCVWCVSIWVAILIVTADALYPEITERAALIFALSALAVIIERHMEVQYERLTHVSYFGEVTLDNKGPDTAGQVLGSASLRDATS